MSCLNRKTLMILGGVALATWALAPGAVGAVVPLLIALACPIGMLVMMRGAAGAVGGRRCGTATPSGQATTPAADATAAEVARLRSEVAGLKAHIAASAGTARSDGVVGHPQPDGRR